MIFFLNCRVMVNMVTAHIGTRVPGGSDKRECPIGPRTSCSTILASGGCLTLTRETTKMILLKDHSCGLLAVHLTAIWTVAKEGFHMLTDLRPAICSLISSHQTTCLQCGLQCCLLPTCLSTHLLHLVSACCCRWEAHKQRESSGL